MGIRNWFGKRKPASRPAIEKRPVQPFGRPIGIALVGAGEFASRVHLRYLTELPQFHLRGVIDIDGERAREQAERSGAAYHDTDIGRALADPDVEAVLVATRHDTHVKLGLEVLSSGRALFLEKPIALNRDELAKLTAFYGDRGEGGGPVLQAGTYRRFNPLVRRLVEQLPRPAGPMMLCYRQRLHYDPASWVYTPEGGGHQLSHCCHNYDLFTFLTGARVGDVQAMALGGNASHPADCNFVVTTRFDDGSVATLICTTMTGPQSPWDDLDVFVPGNIWRLSDMLQLSTADEPVAPLRANIHDPDRPIGRREQLEAFAASVRSGQWAIPLWQQAQACEIACRAQEQLDRPA